MKTVLYTHELCALEQQVAERAQDPLEYFHRAGLALAAHLRTMYLGEPLHFFAGPGHKGTIALATVLELYQSEAVDNVQITLMDDLCECRTDHACEFWILHSRIPQPLWKSSRPVPNAVVIDGMLGFDHTLSCSNNALCQALTALPNEKIAIEIPFGIEADTGKQGDVALKCDYSVVFVAPLVCHMFLPSRSLCGRVLLCSVGIEHSDVKKASSNICHNSRPDFRPLLPQPSDHKYSRGTVAVVASARLPGAAYLAAAAAQRSAAGAVFILSPTDKVQYFQQMLPSAITVECKSPRELLDALENKRISTVVVGPGLLEIREDGGLLMEILKRDIPTVVDASALSALLTIRNHLPPRTKPFVITPHQAEFDQLFPDLRGVHPIQAVRKAAKIIQAAVVLKGYTTLVGYQDALVLNINAKPDLAVAGSGDVLSGILAAALACIQDPLQAACTATWWHAAAGRGVGLIAEDIIANLPSVMDDALDDESQQPHLANQSIAP